MATLSGNKIKDTYQSLVKFSDNGNITTSAKQLTDGFGNNSPMWVSTTQVGIGVTPESGLNLHVYGDAKIGSNLTVIGNLVVEGSTTTVGTDTLTVKDPLIVLANNNTSTDAVDIGFYGKYTPSGTTLYSGLFREALTGKYRLFKDLQEEPTTTVNTSGTGYTKADLVIGALEATTGTFSGNVDIDGTLDVDDVISVEGSGFGRIEVGGASGGYIDLKAPNSDDYDFRLITSTGGAELYSIDTLKFYTGATTDLAITIDASQDVTLEENLILKDAKEIIWGNDFDLKMYHNNTKGVIRNTTGSLDIQSVEFLVEDTSGSNWIKTAVSGAVQLYYGGSLKLSTSSTGIQVTGDLTATNGVHLADSVKASFGNSDDLEIYHNGSSSYISNDTGNFEITSTGSLILQDANSLKWMMTNQGGSVLLYYNGASKLTTTNTGVSVTGRISNLTDPSAAQDAATKAYVDSQVGANNQLSEVLANGNTTGGTDIAVSSGDDITFADSSKSIYGAGSDLQIYSDGTVGYIKGNDARLVNASGENIFRVNGDVAELYYNDSKKLETTSSGIAVTGNADVSSTVLVGGADSIFAENNIRFKSAGTAYIDHNTVGQSFIFRTSNSSSLDTTALTINSSGNATFSGNVTIGDNSASEIFLAFNSSSTDFALGANGSNFMIGTSSDLDTGNLITLSGANGRLGIGTTSPANKLTVSASNTGTQITTNPVGKFINTGNSFSKLIVGSDNNNFDAVLSMDNNSTLANTKLRIYIGNGTNATTGHSNDHIVLQGDGNVGIGTTSPNTILEIASGNSGGDAALDAPVFRINNTTESADWDVGDVVGSIEYYTSDTSGNAPYVTSFIKSVNETGNGTLPDGALSFGTATYNASGGAVERMRIDSSGNSTFAGKILVGTGATAAASLNAYTQTVSANLYSALRIIENSGASSYWDIGATGGGSPDLNFYVNGGTTPKLTIDSSGNVGIGLTDTSAVKLGVSGNSGLPATSGTTQTGLLRLKASNNATLDIGCDHTTAQGWLQVTDVTSLSTEYNLLLQPNGGNVGIGTTSPVSTHRVTIEADSSNGTSQLYLKRDSTDQGLYIDAGAGSAIYNSHEGTNTIYGRHIWQSTKGTDTVERMRIESSGNVGIGTTMDINKLDVAGNINVQGGNGSYLTFNNGDANIVINNNGSGRDLSFKTYDGSSNSERMRIDKDGNVGIGTTAPFSDLSINVGVNAPSSSGNMASEGLTVHNASGGRAVQIGVNESGAYNYIQSSYVNNSGVAVNLAFFTGASERMRIDSSGNVGIGTSSPSDYNASARNLVVYSTGNTGITIASNNTSSDGTIRFADGTGGTAGYRGSIQYSHGGDFMNFNTAASERMRIDSSGNLALGTTITTVGGSSASSGTLTPTRMLFNNNYSNGYTDASLKLYLFNYGTTRQGFTSGPNYDLQYHASGHSTNSQHSFYTNNNFVMRVGTGDTTNVGIGTDSPSYNLDLLKSNAVSMIRTPDTTSPTLGLFVNSGSNGVGTISVDNGGHMTFDTGSTGAGQAERMRINSSGSVGIGTSTPSAKLDLDNGSSDCAIRFGSDTGDWIITNVRSSHALTISDSDGTGEVFRIDTLGQVMIGTTTTQSKLEVRDSKTGSFNSPHFTIYGSGYGAFQWLDTDAYHIYTNSDGRDIEVICYANGVRLEPSATAWVSNSDISLKENIKPLENVLDKIKDYRCVEYNFKDDKVTDKKIGFIAQDWENDFGAVISKDKNEKLGIKYTETIPVLLKAIQELKAEVEQLKTQINK